MAIAVEITINIGRTRTLFRFEKGKRNILGLDQEDQWSGQPDDETKPLTLELRQQNTRECQLLLKQLLTNLTKAF